MKNPTNQDLHIMLVEMRGDIKSIVKDVGALTTGFSTHIASDAKEFKTLNENINNLNRYAASIAIVASAIGGGTLWVWNKITGQSS